MTDRLGLPNPTEGKDFSGENKCRVGLPLAPATGVSTAERGMASWYLPTLCVQDDCSNMFLARSRHRDTVPEGGLTERLMAAP
ncbi:hypothetical protein VUR80DRAFT_4270 [Thermomyces stellatus]